MIRDTFIQTIKKYGLINKGETIIIAISGGSDSIVLTHLLHQIKEKWDLKLYGFHLDHCTRNGASHEDAAFVKKHLEKLDIEGYFYSVDIKEKYKHQKLSFEEAARKERYQLLDALYNKLNADKIALGQNLNDQGETLLFRLFRGSGLVGLTGIDYLRDKKYIRPIMELSKEEIEKFCEKQEIPYAVDKTNFETIYSRNKIRQELIPYIKENFNSNIEHTLARTAELLTEENDFIQQQVEKAFDVQCRRLDGRLVVSLEDFDKNHIAVKRRLIRKMIEFLTEQLKNVSFHEVQSVVEMIETRKTGKYREVNGVIFRIEYDRLVVFVEEDRDQKSTMQKSLKVNVLSKWDKQVLDIDQTIVIDYGKVQGKLTIRTRQPGDIFQPLGMEGTKKLKDFFIDEKISRFERDNILLVCDEENIIWVVGYRMSHKYRVTKDTRQIAKLSLVSC